MLRLQLKQESCRLRPKLCARLLIVAAAAIYAATLSAVIRQHSDPSRHQSLNTNPNDMSQTHISSKRAGRSRPKGDQEIAHFIAHKWNLTTPHATFLLHKQFALQNAYNPHTDFLHFHHIAKTGGTTISDILEASFGKYVTPGSERSNSFDEKEFYLAIQNKSSARGRHEIPEFKVSYGHTRLRPINGPDKTDLSRFLLNYISSLPIPKRLRSLAMLREPTDLRASAHAMAMCALNGKVNTFNYWREKRNETRVCTKEEGLDVQAIVEEYHAKVMTKCPSNNTKGEAAASLKKLDRFEKKICNKGPESMSYCLSPSHLLTSGAYEGMRSMYKSLLGRYFAQQHVGKMDYVSVEHLMKRIDKSKRNDGGAGVFKVEKIEEYVLVDLGALDYVEYEEYDMTRILSRQHYSDSTNSVPPDLSAIYEPDVLWFGITERMAESTCLLFHTLNIKPIAIPKSRVVNCPPTSWWTIRDREEVKMREAGDYAVWRVGNAILDVRVEKMQREVRGRLRSGTLSAEEKSKLGGFVKAGCLDFDFYS
jgi:hypothetical protein